jgi:stearoyl-CoA desaturase (delta-9 desaturase)
LYKQLPIQWFVVVLLGAYHGLAVAALFQPFQLRYLPIAIAMYLWFGFSATFFLHRYLAHRSFETGTVIRTLGFLGIAAGQLGNPAGWVAHHRWHHAYSDTEKDVHSPRDGLMYAYIGWVLRIPGKLAGSPQMALGQDVRDRHFLAGLAMKRPVLLLLPHLAVALTACHFLGFGGMCWTVYVPLVSVYQGAWAVNAFCHSPGFGSRGHETKDTSRNSRWLAFLTLGDAWHNNHHAHPIRAAHGQGWREFDPTGMLITVLEKLGLVWDVKRGEPLREPSPSGITA